MQSFKLILKTFRQQKPSIKKTLKPVRQKNHPLGKWAIPWGLVVEEAPVRVGGQGLRLHEGVGGQGLRLRRGATLGRQRGVGGQELSLQ